MPSDHDAELLIISCILQEPGKCLEICSDMGVEDATFYFPASQILYRLLCSLWAENEPIALKVLMSELERAGTTGQVAGRIEGQQSSGYAFVSALWHYSPTPALIGKFIAMVKECADRRISITAGQKIIAAASDMQTELDEVYGTVEATMLQVNKMREGKKLHARTIADVVKLALDDFEKDLARTTIDTPTGLRGLDYYTDGLVAPEVTALIGKPSDFKTCLALNIAEHIAVDQKKRVGIISLEMGDIQLGKRVIFSRAEVDIRKAKKEKALSSEDWEKVHQAAVEVAQSGLLIRDDGGMNISEISAQAATWKAKGGLDLLIIDHAQLARGVNKHNSRTEEVEEVSNALKPMAKRLGIPIMVLSQVSTDSHGNYSTKQSKALEADADNIWVISHVRDEKTKQITESYITLSKQRDRERHVVVPVRIVPALQRFYDIDNEPVAEQPELVSIPNAKKTRK